MRISFFKKCNYLISYLFIRAFGIPISLLSFKNIHRLGKGIGILAYYLIPEYRKRVFNNLAIASKLELTTSEKKNIAIQSFQNLSITSLEFFRMKRKKDKLAGMIFEHNSQTSHELLGQKRGVIFLLGHMANWEIPFIKSTRDYEGVAIGKPLKNPYINRWILEVRQMNGGRIIYPRSAITVGLKELKAGRFLGIVGDQALPESPYSYPFLGLRAWTTPTPALLAYRTGCPIVVLKINRDNYKYHIHHSDPIWPDLNNPLKQEVNRVMDLCMHTMELNVIENPGQWLWQHDRWKQSGMEHVKREFRHAFIFIIFSKHFDQSQISHLKNLFRKIYPNGFLTFAVFDTGLSNSENEISSTSDNQISYKDYSELLIEDWRHQLVVDFSNHPKITKHFKQLGAFQTLTLDAMQQKAKKNKRDDLFLDDNFASLVTYNLCK